MRFSLASWMTERAQSGAYAGLPVDSRQCLIPIYGGKRLQPSK